MLFRSPWRTLMLSTFKNRNDRLPKSPPMLDFGSVLTILISTEFNVVALPFCKPYCFESEILYCPPLKVPLLVFEKPLEHVLSGSNNVSRSLTLWKVVSKKTKTNLPPAHLLLSVVVPTIDCRLLECYFGSSQCGRVRQQIEWRRTD